MVVRVVKGGRRRGRDGKVAPPQTMTYPCSHYGETFYPDGMKFELCNVDGKEGIRKIVRIPRDGHTVYFMEGGKNFDIKRWPPRSMEKYLRGGVVRDEEEGEDELEDSSITSGKLQMRG